MLDRKTKNCKIILKSLLLSVILLWAGWVGGGGGLSLLVRILVSAYLSCLQKRACMAMD